MSRYRAALVGLAIALAVLPMMVGGGGLILMLAIPAILAAAFGPAPLINALDPTKGVEMYRLNRFGFFRGGGW